MKIYQRVQEIWSGHKSVTDGITKGIPITSPSALGEGGGGGGGWRGAKPNFFKIFPHLNALRNRFDLAVK